MIFNDPTTLEKRAELAQTCTKALKLNCTTLVDTMNDRVNKAYAAWPERLYILDKAGKVVYQGGPGPRGFQVKEMEGKLASFLADKKNHKESGFKIGSVLKSVKKK